MTNMFRAVEAKKQNLTDVKHGAVAPSEPKYVWVKMLDCPNGFDRLLAAKNIFNNTLESLLVTRKYHYIIDINHRMVQPRNFTLENKLNADGRNTLWNEIDSQLKNFDYQRITLKPLEAEYQPVPRVTPKTIHYDTGNKDGNTRRLPTPPNHQGHQTMKCQHSKNQRRFFHNKY